MNNLYWRWARLLVCGALAACATPQPSGSESAGCGTVAQVAFSFEEACAHADSLLALCGAEQCGLYRCAEVARHLAAGQIVLARGATGTLPGSPGAQRYWGSAQPLPGKSRPVFIIPWGPRPAPLPSQQQQLADEEARRRKPHEKHHIFSRAFREWFANRKINIDEYTMPLEVEKHRSIHRGAKGGPWNAAWDKFIFENPGATKDEIFRYAGQLIYEFELLGPVVPYWRQPIRPMPSGY
ncbi:MAG: TIGR02269 family lipoprotein [Myxococcaceae bacterium]|nr:TIGR02269 family lipoprotein [Myxococcaceae bacterium]